MEFVPVRIKESQRDCLSLGGVWAADVGIAAFPELGLKIVNELSSCEIRVPCGHEQEQYAFHR